MTNYDDFDNREDNIDDKMENGNVESLNEAYDRVSGNGAQPSLEDFLGGDFDEQPDPFSGEDSGLGSVIGDPSFSDDPVEGTDGGYNTPEPEESAPVRFNPKSIIDGSYFRSEEFAKKIPFIVFLVLMALVYITNRNVSEALIKTNINLRKEVRDLRAESITIAGQLMNISKETEVSARVEKQQIGVHEQHVPPMYFVIDKFEREDSLVEEMLDVPKRDYVNDFNDFEDEYKKMN